MTEPRRLDVVGTKADPPSDHDPDDRALPPWLAFEMALAAGPPDEPAHGRLRNVAGVRLRGGVAEIDAGDAVYRRGAKVLCDTTEGPAWGIVTVASRRKMVEGELPRILRVASHGDLATEAQLRSREQAVYAAARSVIGERQPAVKVVRAEALGGGQRFAVYVAAEERFAAYDVLDAITKATGEQAELRQLGLRDAAKILGGVGPCGLQLCCNTFLSEFAPVTIKMAKDQGLGVNPQKLSGLCGRLLCCLVYEEAFYRAQRQLVPRLGERVRTDEGAGSVRDVDVLELVAQVTLDSGKTIMVPVSALTRGEGQ